VSVRLCVIGLCSYTLWMGYSVEGEGEKGSGEDGRSEKDGRWDIKSGRYKKT